MFKIAFEAGDYFPIWTPFAQRGYGSPLPFFYHRLYSTVVASIAMLLDSTYWAVKLSIPLILTFGAMGMHKASQAMKLPLFYCITASVLLITANYTATNWLIRGATAELLAAMLVSWLLYFYLTALKPLTNYQKINLSLKISLTLALIFYAHSVIFYYSCFVGLFLFITLVIRKLISKNESLNLSIIGLVSIQLLIFIGVYAGGIIIFKDYFSFSAFTKEELQPKQNFRSIGQYFSDSSFNWGEQWAGLSVEIGKTILIIFIISVFIILLNKIVKPVKKLIKVKSLKQEEIQFHFIFLSIVFCTFLYLQDASSIWFYEVIPGANYIQFSWRLLSFITPATILLTFSLLNIIEFRFSSKLSKILKQTVVISMIVIQVGFYISIQNVEYERFTSEEISSYLKRENLSNSLVFGGEYLPSNVPLPNNPAEYPLITHNDACEISSIVPKAALETKIHFKKIDIEIEATGNCSVFLNQFYNPFIVIDLDDNDEIEITNEAIPKINVKSENSKITIIRQGLLQGIMSQL
ncbi:MAG: hypothetical protein ACOC4B_00395 [Bacteroidota bacterium]